MADNPSVAAALRNAAAQAAGLEPNPDDVYLATYGEPRPSLAATVGYDDYMRHIGLPVVQASGAHYSAPGSREGYETRGLPPVVMQRNPYATAAYRTFVDPWGQMMVQPLVGFPSAYPHVLSGVPTDLGNTVGYAMSLLGPLPQYRPTTPPSQAAAPAARRAAARNTGGGEAAPSYPAPQFPAPQAPGVTPQAPRYGYGDPLQADYPQGPATRRATPPLISQLQPQVQAPSSAAERPWYAPIIDDVYNMLGIRFPQMSYQPQPRQSQWKTPAALVGPPAPAPSGNSARILPGESARSLMPLTY